MNKATIILAINVAILVAVVLCLSHRITALERRAMDYMLSGSRADQVKQIGNSVPVRTAKAIVKAIFGKAA